MTNHVICGMIIHEKKGPRTWLKGPVVLWKCSDKTQAFKSGDRCVSFVQWKGQRISNPPIRVRVLYETSGQRAGLTDLLFAALIGCLAPPNSKEYNRKTADKGA